MKPRDYCCCAIPTVNAGIYVILFEQFVLGMTAGTLAVATPQIVGAATPSFAKWIFAIVCYVGAAAQVFGFLGVWKERPIMYRRYTTLHILLLTSALSIAAVWIILSAARHNQAKSSCLSTFFTVTTGSLGDTLCEIFPWVDVGLMGGLWVILASVQLYLYFVASSYGTGQRLDHEKYDSMYDPTRPLTSDIPLSNRGWQGSDENVAGAGAHGGYHTKGESISSLYTDKPQQAQDYGYNTYPPSVPNNAYTQDPGPTPRANEYYAATGSGAPEPVQSHPGTSRV